MLGELLHNMCFFNSFTMALYDFKNWLSSKEYNEKTREMVMAEAAAIYVETIVKNRDVAVKLRKFFSRFFKDIDEASKRLPVFLQVAIGI